MLSNKTRNEIRGYSGVVYFSVGGAIAFYILYTLLIEVTPTAEVALIGGFVSFLLMGFGLLHIIKSNKLANPEKS